MCVRSFGMDPASFAGGVVVAMHRMVDLLGIRSGGPSSVQPAMIGRRIEIVVDLHRVQALCEGRLVGARLRRWCCTET